VTVDRAVLGIVGAGKLGTAVARAAVKAGSDVTISGSGAADRIALTVDVLAPGARAATTAEVVHRAEMIVLAVPTHRFRELPRDLFAGKTLIDAMNYWEPVDGVDPELAAAADGTSVVIQDHFASARVVKSMNQLGYHQFEELTRPRGAADRIAVAVAGDDGAAVDEVMLLVDTLGFDPVDAGPLRNGIALEPDGSPYATTYTAPELAEILGRGGGRPKSANRAESVRWDKSTPAVTDDRTYLAPISRTESTRHTRVAVAQLHGMGRDLRHAACTHTGSRQAGGSAGTARAAAPTRRSATDRTGLGDAPAPGTQRLRRDRSRA
jgi:hypothetical protein